MNINMAYSTTGVVDWCENWQKICIIIIFTLASILLQPNITVFCCI